ncbi:hypothetical protein [Mesorhizobium sp.]|uniref:hypothetical protein n=1 Tax=Mesorhizobium sp. TaxID=1871066 RepID=UPI002579FB25|nr:hypothetical protein [Mesorhizobium sp.]
MFSKPRSPLWNGVSQLAPDLSEPFKSKGIADLEDGTLVIRAKFTAKPGKQFAICRAALKAVHNAFRENGIRAVPKPTKGQWLSRDGRSPDVGYLSGRPQWVKPDIMPSSMASRTERSAVRWPALARRLQLFTFPDVSRSAKVTHSA